MTEIWNALDRLDGGTKWRRNSLCDADGNRCILGAISNARIDTDYYSLTGNDDIHLVASIIRAEFPDRWNQDGLSEVAILCGVYGFNDDPDTTYQDVERVLEKAAIRQDEVLS